MSVKSSSKVNEATQPVLFETREYKVALKVFANGRVAKYVEVLALYLRPQGATTSEVKAYLAGAGYQPEAMVNCYRTASEGKFAEAVPMLRVIKGEAKKYKAYALKLTPAGKAKFASKK